LKKSYILVLLIVIVLIIDQVSKVYIKLNYPLYGGFNIFGLEWARIYFIVVDSAFYGLIFSDSSPHSRNIAEFMPEGGGYEGFLQGKVVDMFHFPMINSRFPEWLPVWGGDAFSFFRPVYLIY